MIRVRAIGVIPEDNSSSISVIGGHVSATAQAAPEIDFSYFLTDNIALELIAIRRGIMFRRPERPLGRSMSAACGRSCS
jgi:outer membrane protein W